MSISCLMGMGFQFVRWKTACMSQPISCVPVTVFPPGIQTYSRQVSHSDPQGHLHVVLWAPKHRYYQTALTLVSPWVYWRVEPGEGTDMVLFIEPVLDGLLLKLFFKIMDLKLRSVLRYCLQFSEWVSKPSGLAFLIWGQSTCSSDSV